jgi:signal transduction histidine kinase
MDDAARLATADLDPSDGDHHVRKFLGAPAEHNHIVQFYEHEDFLYDNVAHFLAAGLKVNEPVIVIATEAHRTGFVTRLKLHGIDVAAAIASNQLVLLDAQETLDRFMVDGAPNGDRFRDAIVPVIEQVRRGRDGQRVRAYGEMVDLLWRAGNRQAAIRLEELWNDLGTEHTFSLLCAYVMGNFYRSDDADPFHHVCNTHTHVLPTESMSRLATSEARSRELMLLQQRAASLENEVAHRKELEATLREALAREKAARVDAERSVRFNEMFSGMLGHDLRNPLGTIAMGAAYLARSELGEKPTRAAGRITSAAERMARMIDQLLDFTRIRVGGGLQLDRTRVDLVELCSRVVDELEAANPECNITIDPRGSTVGLWDHDRLLQVFSNLVGNAISHGAPSCKVTLEADGTDPSMVVATVHNFGCVPDDILPVMFEPFRGTNKRHKTSGLGLGLFITRQIVLAHGGTVDVTSNDLQGTKVRVKLPRFPASEESASTLKL